MIQRLCALLCMVIVWTAWTGLATAQNGDQRPMVEVELSVSEVIPGQPALLRITVLVPTWLPKPVVFPSFEAPDVMVKLLERSTNPTSRDVDGETWSGVSRVYRISPMVPGTHRIPEQVLGITWAEPGKTDPLISDIPVGPIEVTGIVPSGAEDLDPFLAATEVSLTEEFSSEARVLKPGDSLTRTVTAKVSGTSPVFLPPLLGRREIPGVASYPAEPQVVETADRTWLSGTRVEQVTLVAETGGGGEIPPIEVRWFNLESGQVESARLDGVTFTVDGPAPASERRWTAQQGVLLFCALCAVSGVCFFVWRLLRPWGVRVLAERKAARLASEAWAFRQLQSSIALRDYPLFSRGLDVWVARVPGGDPREDAVLKAAEEELGAALFGTEPNAANREWDAVKVAVADARKRSLGAARSDAGAAFKPLNPF